MKRLVMMVLAILMLSPWLFATGSKEKAAPALVEVTHLVYDRGIVPADQGTIEDNWYTRYVNEQMAPLGIHVKFVPVPRGMADQKLSTMMAGGTAPDFCMTWDTQMVSKYAAAGGILDLKPYIDKYGTNLKKLYTAQDYAAFTFSGKVAYLKRIQQPNVWQLMTFIRKDYLDRLNLQAPRTVDELYNTLVTIKKNAALFGFDSRMAPFATEGSTAYWIDLMLPAFVDKPPVRDRFVVPFPMWPEAKDAIRFLNKLYNEGLLADLILDKDNSLFNQKLISGEAAVFMEGVHYLTAPAYGYLYDKILQQNPNAKFVPTLPWKRNASDKDLYEFYPYGDSRYGIGWFVPVTTKHPDEVVKYINWLGAEENYRLPALGVKDVDYKQTSDGFDSLITPEAAAKKLAWIPPCYEVLSHPYQSTALVAKSLYGSLPHFNEYLGWLKVVDQNANPAFSIPTVNLPTPALDQYGAIVQRNWDNALPKMIVAPVGQFDSLFDTAVDAYKKDGGDAIATEALANYKQFYGK